MFKELMSVKSQKGTYSVLYLSADEAHGEPAGIYADIHHGDGSGYSQRCTSYREAAHIVFSEHGTWAEYASYL